MLVLTALFIGLLGFLCYGYVVYSWWESGFYWSYVPLVLLGCTLNFLSAEFYSDTQAAINKRRGIVR